MAVGYALVALAACSWGTWPLILRSAEHVAPMSAAFESSVLMVVLALVTGPLVLRDRIVRRATALVWLGVGWLGVGDALNAYFFFRAYQTTSVAIAVLTHYLAPLFVALGSPLLLRERPTLQTAVAIGIGFSGSCSCSEPWSAARPHPRGCSAPFSALPALSSMPRTSFLAKRLTAVFSGSEQMFFHCFVAFPSSLSWFRTRSGAR